MHVCVCVRLSEEEKELRLCKFLIHINRERAMGSDKGKSNTLVFEWSCVIFLDFFSHSFLVCREERGGV